MTLSCLRQPGLLFQNEKAPLSSSVLVIDEISGGFGLGLLSVSSYVVTAPHEGDHGTTLCTHGFLVTHGERCVERREQHVVEIRSLNLLTTHKIDRSTVGAPSKKNVCKARSPHTVLVGHGMVWTTQKKRIQQQTTQRVDSTNRR